MDSARFQHLCPGGAGGGGRLSISRLVQIVVTGGARPGEKEETASQTSAVNHDHVLQTTSQQTGDIHQWLDQCWSSVVDGGPTLIQPLVNVLFSGITRAQSLWSICH